MILVREVDYFRKSKISDNLENELFLKKIMKIVHKQKLRRFVYFSSRLDGFEITYTSIRKNTLKTLIFFNFFSFLNQKIVK